MLKGSNRYFNIYFDRKTFVGKMRVFRQPDSYVKVMINDYSNQVDLSSFVFDGKIIVKIRRRFMIFD